MKTVIASVDDEGIWREQENSPVTQTLKIEGACLISDRWQLGASVPLIRRSTSLAFAAREGSGEKKFTGLGDVSTTLAYEILPEWEYNPWRPKGTAFLQLSYPTGKPRAASTVGGSDSRGNGFWSTGAGIYLSKLWGNLDVFTTFETHRSFAREIFTSQLAARLVPGLGGSAGFGAGIHLNDWRLGTSINFTYEDPVKIEGSITAQQGAERFATGVLALTRTIQEQWSATISYSDQTLFGSPRNTSLGRSGSIQVQRRWAR